MTERASGTLSAALGLAVAFTMLLGTVQLLARLHHTTVAMAVVTDAARSVAEQPLAGDLDEARRRADALAVRLLGPDATLAWRVDSRTIGVEVRLPSPHLPGLGAEINRTVVIRRERLP